MPVMRVHSEKQVTAHFPWLWGQKAAEAIQEAGARALKSLGRS